MYLPEGKIYVKYQESPILPLMLRLIKNNKIGSVQKILELNEKYFYPEKPTSFNDVNGFDLLHHNVVNVKDETCYTTVAINQKNIEMLKLLLDYGFAVQIIKKKEVDSEDLVNTSGFGIFTYNDNILIDLAHPFITEDPKIFEILLHTVTDLNEIFQTSWKDQAGNRQYHNMSLLSLAILSNKMELAEILIDKGARLGFNLYFNLLEYTKGFCGTNGTFLNAAILDGYMYRSIEYSDTLAQLSEWSPITIILNKGDRQQIDWMVRHSLGNPALTREISKSIYCLRNHNFYYFMKEYPQFIELIEWRDICNYSNVAALNLYLIIRKPKLRKEDILSLFNFHYQTSRPLNEVFDYVLSPDLYQCVKIIQNYDPDLFQIEMVQNEMYNTALYIECIKDGIKKWCNLNARDDNKKHEEAFRRDKEKVLMNQKVEQSLLYLYDELAAYVPDVTPFVQWYYTKGRETNLYPYKSRDAVEVIKMCNRQKQKEKPRINLELLNQEDTPISQMELAAIIDNFKLYSVNMKLHELYKMVIKKDSIPLLKKMLNASILQGNELQLITEYAIDVGAEKLIPMLLLTKMKKKDVNNYLNRR